MRILVLCAHRRHAGGVERYLEGVISGLVEAGHEVAMLALRHGLPTRPPIALPDAVPAWVVEADEGALRAAHAWKADVAYVHTLEGEALLAQLQRELPTVYFAHDYAGCCVSGFKTWQSVPRTCQRVLGPGCLAHFYPHRCGGLNPVTTLRSYRTQRRRQVLLRDFSLVVGGSAAMLAEIDREGVRMTRALHVPYYVPAVEQRMRAGPALETPRARLDPKTARLLFVGRVDRLKGGALLLDALPHIAAALDRQVHVDVAGDGPDLGEWRGRAARVGGRARGRVGATFHGWIGGAALEALWSASALLVVPSIWPEPFGLVGPEAGARGMPAAAFAVGGITDWLTDGENGHVAAGDGRLESDALAASVVRALSDEAHWQRLREGAMRLSTRFRLAPHLAALEATFFQAGAGHAA